MDFSNTLYIYTRVSTTSQEEEGTSLEVQKNLGIQKSKDLGFDYQLFNEGGQSSSNDDLLNRPVLTELLKKVDKGEIKHLFVFNTDRLSRNKITWNTIRLKLIKNGVKLYTPTGIFDSSSPTDDLLLGILSEISSYDNLLRTERTRLGKINKIKLGYWMGGPPPFGYSVVDKKLVVNQEESNWVKFIFEKFLGKSTVRQIKNELLLNGVKTRRNNGVWSHGSIEKLLTNTHYIGYYTITDNKTGEIIKSTCEPIISTDLYRSVEELRKSRSSRRIKEPNQKSFHLLRDFLICGCCGSRFSSVKVKTTKRQVYFCPRKIKNYKDKNTPSFKDCESTGFIKQDLTDELVWNSVLDVLTNSSKFKEETKLQILGEKVTYRESKLQLTKLLKDIKKLDNEIRDYRDIKQQSVNQIDVLRKFGTEKDIENQNIIIKNIEKAIHDTVDKKQLILNQISRLEKSIDWVDWLSEHKNILKKLHDLNLEEKYKVLSRVLDKIIVTRLDNKTTELIINFKLPYVDDEFVWNDVKDKNKGYLIKNGKKDKKVVLVDEKKYQRNQMVI